MDGVVAIVQGFHPPVVQLEVPGLALGNFGRIDDEDFIICKLPGTVGISGINASLN